MYTILAYYRSGARRATVTDTPDLKDVIVNWLKDYSACWRIEIIMPTHQERVFITYDSKMKVWVEKKSS